MSSDRALLGLARRVVDGCPAPALLVAANGTVELANVAARSLVDLPGGIEGQPVRDLLGLGWRELEVVAKERRADLVARLPHRGSTGEGRGARVRLEPVEGGGGRLAALLLFLEPAPAATGAAPPRRGRPQGLEAIFGSDPAVLATKDAAERFAKTLLPVLLLAETGTGKELLARAIHAASPRSSQPFVAINCGALSAQLLESELFGYAPGAFTGASREGHEGKIGAARGGTLFLDEVAEMPAPLQALLLRVLEDGTYYRVGESRPRQADVRLICATGRDLPSLVGAGAFRQDLFYRINGACLGLPPVRARSDLPELILHLLGGVAAELGHDRPPRLSAAAAEWMARLPWPGNVRQLKTALQYALILSDGGEIGVEHLPREPASASGAPTPARAPEAASAPTLAEIEAEDLRSAVRAARGNLSSAAAELGIARSTLYRRLRRHGMIPG
ncbi:MAG: sigma 54-interacting transcriptional regulator [Acidobacteria bacterium]|nr:sigma 54-interacting transcriptional regulator [Acidobacteriota bacterium]